jgi:hypothetical protein
MDLIVDFNQGIDRDDPGGGKAHYRSIGLLIKGLFISVNQLGDLFIPVGGFPGHELIFQDADHKPG